MYLTAEFFTRTDKVEMWLNSRNNNGHEPSRQLSDYQKKLREQNMKEMYS
jgi:hypothetical protein